MMRVALASESVPGRSNEDFAGAVADAAVLLDGAGLSDVDDGGCRHGVAWYARQFGMTLLTRLSGGQSDLREIVADGIEDVSGMHHQSCDLAHPGTPSSTVVMLRRTGDYLDYLVLADSVLVIERYTDYLTVCDNREAVIGAQYRATMDSLSGDTPEHDEARRQYVAAMRRHRNQPNGFWVAAADTSAAGEALTGSVPLNQVRSAALLSDGASRLVDRFYLADWPKVMAILADTGPAALIRAVREAESSDPTTSRWPRGKVFDDATVAYCDHLAG